MRLFVFRTFDYGRHDSAPGQKYSPPFCCYRIIFLKIAYDVLCKFFRATRRLPLKICARSTSPFGPSPQHGMGGGAIVPSCLPSPLVTIDRPKRHTRLLNTHMVVHDRLSRLQELLSDRFERAFVV